MGYMLLFAPLFGWQRFVQLARKSLPKFSVAKAERANFQCSYWRCTFGRSTLWSYTRCNIAQPKGLVCLLASVVSATGIWRATDERPSPLRPRLCAEPQTLHMQVTYQILEHIHLCSLPFSRPVGPGWNTKRDLLRISGDNPLTCTAALPALLLPVFVLSAIERQGPDSTVRLLI